jgi:glyceraldehyde 3-phosphate dehydrogenase
VLVSATSAGADRTVVMGFNETDYSMDAPVVSYGSCTVNAFVPLAQHLHQRFGVREADVHVIHNVAAHRLADHPHPQRRPCTLESMAPALLPWLSPDRFFVCYTLIPYTGPSLIDFRFRLGVPTRLAEVHEALYGPSSGLGLRYEFPAADGGVLSALGRPCNAVIPRRGVRLAGDSLLLRGYFDNENSAVRYLELVQRAAQAHAVALLNRGENAGPQHLRA